MGLYTALDLAKKPDEIRNILNILQEQGELSGDLTVEEVQNILENTDKNIKVKMNEKVAMAVSISTTEALYTELLQMNWCLYRAPSNAFFICGDAPLVCFVLNPDGTAIFGGGFRLPNAEITFPISPEKCIYIDRKHPHKYRAVSHRVVKEINRRTAWAAERFIISTHKCNYSSELLQWSAKSIEKPKMDKKELLKLFETSNLFE